MSLAMKARLQQNTRLSLSSEEINIFGYFVDGISCLSLRLCERAELGTKATCAGLLFSFRSLMD